MSKKLTKTMPPKAKDKGEVEPRSDLSPTNSNERKAERRAAYLAESTKRQAANIEANEHKD